MMRRNPKLSLGKILHPGAFLEGAVEAGELGDLFLADLLTFVAEALAHLGPRLAGVDQLYLATSLRGSCGW